MKRREMVELLALAPLAAAFRWAPHDVARAVSKVRASAQRPELRFFSAHEWDTVRILVDLVIPRDERSGSATEALVPEFMDFIVAESTSMQTPMRGGLAWLDLECRRRYTKSFIEAPDGRRVRGRAEEHSAELH